MYSIVKRSAAILICFIALHGFSQMGFQAKKLSASALKNDFLVLKDTLQKIHPGLYRYKNKTAMDNLFDSCYRSIRDSMNVLDFYTLTRFVIAAIQDGHTNCKLPQDQMNEFFEKAGVFPAMVMFIHNKPFILCSRQNDSLAESELLSIDNHPAGEITQRLFRYIQSDAGIESHKNWELPEYFQMLFYTVYGAGEKFAVTYKTKTGNVQKCVLHADFIKNIICAHPFTRPARYLNLEYKPGGIAVLTLKTFFNGFLEQTKENFKTFLDSSFRDINNRKVRKLIIDVRGNQGGNDNNGEILYSYLTTGPFKYYRSLETVTKTFSEKDAPDLALQQPSPDNYTGQVFVLANGRSFSGVAEFSSIVKTNNRGVFIGEACGGGYYGNTSGSEENVVLPNSQISVRVPMVKYTMEVRKLPSGENGIIPDYVYDYSIIDLAESKDSQLNYALKIATGK
jgi:hypothetical protein